MSTPISSAALTAATNSYTTLLGAGATGEVFQGRALDGTPLAVKRLKAPKGAPPELLEALRARFRAELATLAAFRHPRIVRLLHTCEATGDDTHPFALVLELLEGGSLADWLRGPQGEAPPRGTLTPLQRVDAALGVAHGLKYLHGLREAGEEGGGGAPVVHRDVKSANVGFARLAPAAGGGGGGGGGELYAKVIDCGLAKALHGGGGAAGASFSSGVLGTPGYMAPELSDGDYTVASEIYSFGVVLLELLQGQRVGPKTASAAREGAEDEGVGHVVALAEGCWSAPAAAALAALVVDCTHARPKRRPQSMAPVVERLRELRALLAPPVALVLCPVCLEEVPEGEGVRCKAALPAVQHFCCRGCLQEHVCKSVSIEVLARNAGGVPCVAAGCAAPPWTLEDLAPHLDAAAAIAYATGMRYHAFDLPRVIREREEKRRRRDEENKRIADLVDRVRRTRLQVVEEDLTLHCPRCQGAFVDFSGCAALTCKDDAGPPRREGCGISFCALCLEQCGDSNGAHEHVKEAHGKPALIASNSNSVYFFSPADYAAAHKGLRLGLVAARLRGLAGEPAVQSALLAALAVADLPGVGLSAAAVRAAAGMPAVAAEGTWGCQAPACALVNDAGAVQCAACGGGRGGDGSSSSGGGGGGGGSSSGGGSSDGGRQLVLPGPGMSAALVVELMRMGAGAGEVTLAGLKALRALAKAPGGEVRCYEANAVPVIVNALLQGGVEEVEAACWALLNIATFRQGQSACITAGAVPAIVAALEEHVRGVLGMLHGDHTSPVHEGTTRAAEAACGALLHISNAPQGTQACLTSGAIPAIVAALNFFDDPGVAQTACWALQSMADPGAGQEACLREDAVPAIVAALVAHGRTVAGVAEHACWALARLASCDRGQIACVIGGAVPVIVAALRAHASVAGVVIFASWALASIGGSSPAHCAIIVAAGARPLLHAAAAAHNGDARARALAALQQLSSTESRGAAPAAAAELPRAGLGAARCVALMLEAGAGNAAVTSAGLQALVDLTGGAGRLTGRREALQRSGLALEQRCMECLDAGAARAALAALRRGVEVGPTAVVELACTTLRNLAIMGPCLQACVEEGAVPAVATALRAFSGNAAVAEQGCWALANFSAAVPASGQAAAPGPGGLACAHVAVPSIVAALRAQQGGSGGAVAVGVTEWACRALVNISACGDKGVEACMAYYSIPVVVAALRAHGGSAAGVAEYACWTLAQIIHNGPGGSARCGEAAAVPAIVAALRAHSGVAGAVKQACRALEGLCTVGPKGSPAISPSHCAAIVAAGAVPLLAAACKSHEGEAREWALKTLNKLGYTDQGVARH
jgi:hypothetical protein